MSGKKSAGGLKVGDKAPDFVIPDYDGKISLSPFLNKTL